MSAAFLKQGDRIGIIAPSGVVDRTLMEKGCAKLRQHGLIPVYSNAIFERDHFTAGPSQRRLNEIEAYLKSNNVDALWCARGGAGLIELIKPLAAMLQANTHRMPLIGFSDASILHALWQRYSCGATVHAPMIAGPAFTELSPSYERYLFELLLQGISPQYSFRWLTEKSTFKARPIVGGCLTSIVSLLGSGLEVDATDAVFFLEDVNEPFYKLCRSIDQLTNFGFFEHCCGIVVGRLHGCTFDKITRDQALRHMLRKLKLPIIVDVDVGHGIDSLALPLGNSRVINLFDDTFEVVLK